MEIYSGINVYPETSTLVQFCSSTTQSHPGYRLLVTGIVVRYTSVSLCPSYGTLLSPSLPSLRRYSVPSDS